MLMPRLWVSNWRAYNAKDVAEEYAAQTHLQKPEQAVLNLVADTLKNGRMLDIGVGGGRTTYHFAPLVEEYIGIDYAEKMIEACQRKFRSGPGNVSFKLCDATDMSMFRDAYFDFVLASFNCIDYMAHDDRIKTLEEIKRVSKRGSHMLFKPQPSV